MGSLKFLLGTLVEWWDESADGLTALKTRIAGRVHSLGGGEGRVEGGVAGLQVRLGYAGSIFGAALPFEGEGLDKGKYSLHETVSSGEDPGRGDEGAPADVPTLMMQAHLPRPGARLRI